MLGALDGLSGPLLGALDGLSGPKLGVSARRVRPLLGLGRPSFQLGGSGLGPGEALGRLLGPTLELGAVPLSRGDRLLCPGERGRVLRVALLEILDSPRE